MKRTIDVLLAILVGVMLAGFMAYSAGPLFGLDALWPELYSDDNGLGWALLVLLMLIGGLYWRGFWIKSKKRERYRRD